MGRKAALKTRRKWKEARKPVSEPIQNPYYPYHRLEGYNTLPALEDIPYRVRTYLMDMPSAGYTPPDDNRYPRCCLMKYLYYDTPQPLNNPLPTLEQKMSIVFDPEAPDRPPDDEKGFRIFSQSLVHQAQTQGQTIMRIFMGRVLGTSTFRTDASIRIIYLSNASYDANTRTSALSRTFAMACLTVRALNGVNLGAGIGTVYFDRSQHADCGILPVNDESTNVGYQLTMGITMMGDDNAPTLDTAQTFGMGMWQ